MLRTLWTLAFPFSLASAGDLAGPKVVPDAALFLDSEANPAGVRISELGDEPILLLPVFTRCRSVCGVMAEGLHAAWGDAGPAGTRAGVLLVSFDPEDTRDDLLHFRKAHRIPDSWKLASLEREEGLRFFASLDFRWMSLNQRQFEHAGKLYVLGSGRRITAVLGPDQLSIERLSAEVDAARRGPSLARRIGTHWIGALGVGIVLLGLVVSICWDRLRMSGRA